MNLDQIKNEALDLSVDERAILAKILLLSLDLTEESELGDAWIQEASERSREIDNGTVQLVSAEEVRKEALNILK